VTDVGLVHLRKLGVRHPDLGEYTLYAEGAAALLFCDNETNVARLYSVDEAKAYYKDAFHAYVVRGDRSAVNPEQTGTKAAVHYVLKVAAHGSTRVRLRLTNVRTNSSASPTLGNHADV
jgi:hypothetical protein